MKVVIFTQYVPRLFRIYPLYKEVTRTSGIITKTAWAGAAFNLFLYMLASHVSLNLKLIPLSTTLYFCHANKQALFHKSCPENGQLSFPCVDPLISVVLSVPRHRNVFYKIMHFQNVGDHKDLVKKYLGICDS